MSTRYISRWGLRRVLAGGVTTMNDVSPMYNIQDRKIGTDNGTLGVLDVDG